MLIGIYQSLSILILVILFYVADVLLMRRYDPKREYGSSRNWVYTILAAMAGVLIIIQPMVWPQLGLQTDAWWGLLIQAIGLALALGGLALHWWARNHLGQFYAERSSDIQEGQYVVDTGPYAYVRHPIYTSYFLLVVGMLLINPALPTLLVAIYAFVDFFAAIRREEKLLVANVPGYAEYKASTPAYFPRIRKVKAG